MLYYSSAQELAGVTVFPDSDPNQEHVFYLLPPHPRLRRDRDGKASFSLIKFRGGDDSTLPKAEAVSESSAEDDAIVSGTLPTIDGEIAGGILTFDTEYTVTDEIREQIRAELDQQVRAKYTRAGRVVPEGFHIELRQPSWTDGDVRLLMEDTPNGLFTSVSKGGKPSLMGNNVASFAAVLAPWQSTLLAESIENTNLTPIRVNYALKFLAKLPPVKISIYASAVDCYTMYKSYGSEINGGGVCDDPDTVVRSITERVMSRDVVRISIDSGGLPIDDKSFQALQEMAIGLVQDWIKQEFYKAPPPRATKEQLQDIQLAHLGQSDFRDLSILISESATVEITKYPQGELGKLLLDGETLKDYVTEVDLSQDEFYQNRTLGIKVYADFPAATATPQPTDILFVEVTAYDGDGPGLTQTWDRDGGDAATANGARWLATWHKIPDQADVRWEAVVKFRAGKQMVMKGTTDKMELNIPVVTPGRARLSLAHTGVPWSAIQNIEVQVNYKQANAEPPEVERTFFLDEKSGETWFDEPIWKERTEAFTLNVKYRLKNANEIQRPEHKNIVVKADRFTVETPFDRYLEVPIQAMYTSPVWKEDVVRLEYKDEMNRYAVTGEVWLSEKGGWRQVWIVPLLNPERTQFRYSWTRRNQEGTFSSTDIPGADAEGWIASNGGTTLQIGDPDSDEDMLRVAVDPLVLVVGLPDSSKTVIRAVVSLKYTQPDGRVDIDQHPFVAGEGAWIWKKHQLDKSKKKYEWWAEYYTKPFSRIAIGSADSPISSENEIVILEPPTA